VRTPATMRRMKKNTRVCDVWERHFQFICVVVMHFLDVEMLFHTMFSGEESEEDCGSEEKDGRGKSTFTHTHHVKFN
jgi:hypothetical protein